MNKDRSAKSKTVQDIAAQFGVPEKVVNRWIRSGEQIDLDAPDVEQLEAWLASDEWSQAADAEEGTSSPEKQASAPRMNREEAEYRKLREEALKLRAESFRLVREASHLRLRWWQKPAIWLAVFPVASATMAAVFWLMGSLYQLNRSVDVLQAQKESLESQKALVESEKGFLKSEHGFLESEREFAKMEKNFGELAAFKTALDELVRLGGSVSTYDNNDQVAYHVLFKADEFSADEFSADEATQSLKLNTLETYLSDLKRVRRITIDVGQYVHSADKRFFAMINRGVPHLREVRIEGVNSAWSPESLLPLENSAYLTALSLVVKSNQLDLRTVGRLRQIEELDVSGTNIDDGMLSELGALFNLRRLDLSNTMISSAGLQVLSLKKLEWLDLSRTKVAGSIGLENFPMLKTLDLNNTLVDDSILIDLEKLESLTFVDLSDTNVDGSTIKEMKLDERDDLTIAFE